MDPLSPPGPLLATAEVARWLDVHPNTVKRIPPDQLPYFRVSTRGDRRYRESDVLAYMEGRYVRA
jgi:hypothetical protein